MNTYRDLALKIFGLLCLIKFIAIAPNTLLMFRYIDSDSEHFNFLTLGASFTPLITYGLGAWICLLKTSSIEKRLWKNAPSDYSPSNTISEAGLLSIGIILIGLYYFVSSSSTLCSLIWSVRNHREIWLDSGVIFRFVPTFIQFPIASVLILKSHSLSNFILNKQSRSIETN